MLFIWSWAWALWTEDKVSNVFLLVLGSVSAWRLVLSFDLDRGRDGLEEYFLPSCGRGLLNEKSGFDVATGVLMLGTGRNCPCCHL